jgi:hypothetical protein
MRVDECKMSKAFVYEWYDRRYAKYYIGAHKGHPDDGYVCSSKIMKAEYRKRPEDFGRKILKTFETFEEALAYESQLLTEANAKSRNAYYNRTNGCQDFIFDKPTTKSCCYEALGDDVKEYLKKPMVTKAQKRQRYERRMRQLEQYYDDLSQKMDEQWEETKRQWEKDKKKRDRSGYRPIPLNPMPKKHYV